MRRDMTDSPVEVGVVQTRTMEATAESPDSRDGDEYISASSFE